MSEETKELAITETQVSVSTADLSGVPEMQAGLARWCEQRIRTMEAEATELEEAHREAFIHKWKTSTLKRQAILARKRVEFYRKMLSALQAGYCLFPTVNCSVFAIRTDRGVPHEQREWAQWNPGDFRQPTTILPAGEGEYVNPEVPMTAVDERQVLDSQQRERTQKLWETEEEFRELIFPLVMSKPHIMDAAGRAMALKVFDEIGIINDQQRSMSTRGSGDPLIVGRILDPRVQYGNHKTLTFLISWHVDTRTL